MYNGENVHLPGFASDLTSLPTLSVNAVYQAQGSESSSVGFWDNPYAKYMSHPYEMLESDPLWQPVQEALADLVSNGDLEEGTARDYIVGYIIKKICETETHQPE